MINRFSSRKTDLGTDFLTDRLQGAVNYDRIAGYFCSSFLEIAGEAVENVNGKVRIICNSDLKAADVAVAGLAAQKMKQEWSEFKPEEVYASPAEMERLGHLYELLKSEKMEIRVLPDEVYGLMHGKAGVITYADGRRTAFVGSVNETRKALTSNYEIVWEDTSEEAADWVQEEFDHFWNDRSAVPLSEFIVNDLQRLSKRHEVSLNKWKKEEEPDVASVVVEEPVCRQEYGLWAHQKYFVARAFQEHLTEGGARLILADMVGLGKTLQLAMSVKLMALYGNKPVLVIVPKTLLYQWQDEMYSMLDMPSAVWSGKCWVDETGTEYPGGILDCPRRTGIVSQGLITAKTPNAQSLLQKTYECVVCDEAHRARRRNSLQNADDHKGQPNNLMRFLQEISEHTHSMLLATATPVQLQQVEVYDLLDILCRPQSAVSIMGDKYSVWRSQPQTGLDYITGTQEPPASESEMWSIMRNPFPPANDNVISVGRVRQVLGISDSMYVLPQDMYRALRPPVKRRIQNLYWDDDFVRTCNPYVRCIVRRTRELLETSINPETGVPYLKKINIALYGEDSTETLVLAGYMREAYEIAEEFCRLMSERVKGAGFMSTMLLRRIGSTMVAGENTAKKMMSWVTDSGNDSAYSYLADDEEEEETEEREEDEDKESELRNLSEEEIECLDRLIRTLALNRDTDPKYLRVRELLMLGTGTTGPWADKGCIVFSQYYDSAKYIAESLSQDLSIPIGLYAGGDKSGIYLRGAYKKETKETIKKMVRERELMVLVGTDAASEGLNLQMLSTLINVDLPWNPTRLEQRKGRIHRIGQVADTIMIYNMMYRGSVEDKVHQKLSERLKNIYDIFGQLPDILEDVWISIAKNDEKAALEAINRVPQKNPFVIKYEDNIPDCGEWEKCEAVLNRAEKIAELKKRW